MSFSTHVNVMPPSLLLSLKRSRNVPGGLGLSSALSLSLLINPMMYLEQYKDNFKILTADWCWEKKKCLEIPKFQRPLTDLAECKQDNISPFIPQSQDIFFHQVNNIVQPHPEGEPFANHVFLQPGRKKHNK